MVLAIRLLLYIFGILFFSIGICLAINVQHLGIQSWDVLHVGLYEKFGLTIGTWSVIVGMILVGISLIIDRSFVQIGTFMNIILVGVFVDLILWLDFLPQASYTWRDVVTIISGIIIMGLAGGMYNAGRVGSGPRDGFMLGISKKWNIPIQRVRIITETIVLVIGLLIGGPVFLFTILFTFIQSPLFQYSYLKLNRWVFYLEQKRKVGQADVKVVNK